MWKGKTNFAGLPWHVFIFVVNGFDITYCINIIVSNLSKTWPPNTPLAIIRIITTKMLKFHVSAYFWWKYFGHYAMVSVRIFGGCTEVLSYNECVFKILILTVGNAWEFFTFFYPKSCEIFTSHCRLVSNWHDMSQSGTDQILYYCICHK